MRDGLIELLQDEQDGRTKQAVLTTAGAASLEEAGRRWSVINQRIEDVLGAESAATLRALSDHVASDEFLAAYHHVKVQNG